ncbi:MAG: acyl-CoA desaturase [Acidimicrobiales bacterium]
MAKPKEATVEAIRSARRQPSLPVHQPAGQRVITALVVFGPLAGVGVAVLALFGRGITWLDLALAVVFYAIAGHGLTAGYHRMAAHRSFKAARWLKVTLAAAGSLGFEGGINGWVANHRRHHAYTDNAGDPHSPYCYGTSRWGRARGALHAHVGWLFQGQSTDEARWIPDLVADRDLVVISRLFPVFCVISLTAPALIGWAATGTSAGAIGGFVWGGLVRVFVLQHSTFAVNSACHLWGDRPFITRETDRSTNFAPLAMLAMGENWHNLHHSNPRLARHGVDRGQLDSTARFIWILERMAFVWDARWPDADALDRSRALRPGSDHRADVDISDQEHHIVTNR